MLRFHIPNMTCGGCAKGVTATLREADPAARVEIALERHEVSIGNATRDAASIQAALRDAGWQAERLAA